LNNYLKGTYQVDRWKDKLKLRVPAILLLAATLLFWGLYDKYESFGPVLFKAPVIADAYQVRGEVTESSGVFTLRVTDTGKRADLRFKLDRITKFSMIRVSGMIRTEHVVEGDHTWRSARILMTQRDEKGKWISVKHSLLPKQGTVPWTKQSKEFDIHPLTFSAELVIQQTGKSGTAQFKDIVAQPVKIKASFIWFRILFVITWAFMALLYYHRCRLNHRKLRILILLNTIAILFGTLMPGDWLGNIYQQLKQNASVSFLQPVASKIENKDKSAVSIKSSDIVEAKSMRIEQLNPVIANPQKLGHFVLFASLCFLVYCSAWIEKQHPVYYFKVGLDILLFAGVTESLQYLTMDRTPSVSDWIIDILGLLTAFALFLTVRFIAQFTQICGKT
jgi:VanZ family protein